MRVYLTKAEIETCAGADLLGLVTTIAEDGKLDLDEIKALRKFLREHQDNTEVVAIGYLRDILERIVADGVIDRDELLELQIALERVIPTAIRTPLVNARKKRQEAIREKEREARRREREQEEKEHQSKYRIRHTFAKVAGVSFPNDNGTSRQAFIAKCKRGEQLHLKHDPTNQYSVLAVQVLRLNGEQIGHAPEYLAERIEEERERGFNTTAVILNVTGGSPDKPTRGVNMAVFFVAEGVDSQEFSQYVLRVLDEESR